MSVSTPTTTALSSRSRPTAPSPRATPWSGCQYHQPAYGRLYEPCRDPEVEEEASIFAPEVTNDNAELDKQIEDLDLSVRSYNCLKRASIHSVRQLVEFSENDLLNIRNFGVKSIEEVKDKLESMGLSLKA